MQQLCSEKSIPFFFNKFSLENENVYFEIQILQFSNNIRIREMCAIVKVKFRTPRGEKKFVEESAEFPS